MATQQPLRRIARVRARAVAVGAGAPAQQASRRHHAWRWNNWQFVAGLADQQSLERSLFSRMLYYD